MGGLIGLTNLTGIKGVVSFLTGDCGIDLGGKDASGGEDALE